MSSKRAYILFGILFAFLIGLIVRSTWIQTVSANSLAKAAFGQRQSNKIVEKLRGNILDRNGISFTNRSQKYIALIKPANMPKSEDERAKMAALLGVQPEILGSLTSKSGQITVETSKEGSDAVLGLKQDWVTIIHSLNRYDSGTLASHTLGYLGRTDGVGAAGLEKAYDGALGNNKIYEIGTVTDAAKNPIKGLGYRMKVSGTDNGLNLKLTLDYHIQKIVEDVMDRNKISGAVVIEDVTTGDILAMASRPNFDPYAIEKYLGSSDRELFNKATAAYNLGSVFKIIDVAAILEDTDIIPETYFCTGSVQVPPVDGKTFKCSSYSSGGHGEVDLEQAFAKSCNSYFINLCLKTDIKNLISMAGKFGLGEYTGIAYQGVSEARGNLPPPWETGDQATANLAIGQGSLLVTPVQVANIIATVANGGIKNRVNVVDSLIDSDGRKVKDIRVNEGHRIISRETAERIKKLMEAVTSYGTGTAAGMEYYGGAGGKTGTAETGSNDVVHAWFAGYFPAAYPKYSIAVFVENGRNGGKVAAPVFSEIAREMTDKAF